MNDDLLSDSPRPSEATAAGFTRQPSQDGVIAGQNGYWGFAAPPVGAGGRAIAAVLPVGIVVMLLVAGGVVLVLHRATAAPR